MRRYCTLLELFRLSHRSVIDDALRRDSLRKDETGTEPVISQTVFTTHEWLKEDVRYTVEAQFAARAISNHLISILITSCKSVMITCTTAPYGAAVSGPRTFNMTRKCPLIAAMWRCIHYKRLGNCDCIRRSAQTALDDCLVGPKARLTWWAQKTWELGSLLRSIYSGSSGVLAQPD